MKNRLYFIPVAAILLTLFIVGTFCDLSLSKAIANQMNLLSKLSASIATLPVSIFFTFISGLFFNMPFKRYKNKKIFQRVFIFLIGCVSFLGGLLCFAITISHQSFSFKLIYGVLISLVFAIPSMYLGYRVYDKVDFPNLFVTLMFVSVFVCFAFVFIEGMKLIIPRMRYFAVSHFGDSFFRPWYSPSVSKEMLDLAKEWAEKEGIIEIAQSFPSGHSNFAFATSYLLMMLPSIIRNEKLEKYRFILFYSGFAFYLFIAFSRIYGGYHYLSDTMFSGLFGIMLYFIANEIYLRKINDHNFNKEVDHANN